MAETWLALIQEGVLIFPRGYARGGLTVFVVVSWYWSGIGIGCARLKGPVRWVGFA
jgi:hypothetical protein